MPELIRQVKITLYIDTNKCTTEKQFDTVKELIEELEERGMEDYIELENYKY